ncbi:hypothetical protein MCHI_001579 [Candidatus Magnetoovum chiemensis]|nr:hypothetical protein MCHI_001579 [Candidatus Magnetoovum chiemensis]
MALLYLLSSPPFWDGKNFNSENYEFGGFLDIVSAGAGDNSQFTVGFCQTKGQTFQATLITYKEIEGLPQIYRISLVFENKIVSVIVQNQPILYRCDEFKAPVVLTLENITNTILQMKTIQETAMSGFSEANNIIPSLRRFLLFYSTYAVVEDIIKATIASTVSLITDAAQLGHITWLAPIRTKPKRTYDGYAKPFSADGEHTPHLLRKLLPSSRKQTSGFQKALETFGKASGLFKTFRIKNFAKEADSPFEQHVVLHKNPVRINSVGYGVSQILPVLTDLLSQIGLPWFAIQQPEVHLHPKAQAAFGDLIFQLNAVEKKRFLIETHSDFIIDRFRNSVKKEKLKESASQVLFFERVKDGNKVTPIPIEPNGDYSEDQPPSFRDFFIKEQLDLLGL